jgi:hypothetical protein
VLHWTPAEPPKPAPPTGRASTRSEHARMLAYAAVRRRRAAGDDGAYWKACAPAAVARAASLRTEAGFRLP